MDILYVIGELRKERDRLNEIILTLERLQGSKNVHVDSEKHRGRRFMNRAAREEVSKRMKRYWEKRRRDREHVTGQPAATGNEGDALTRHSVAA